MATFAERVDAADDRIGSSTIATAVNTAIDSVRSDLYDQVVTAAGRGANSAAWLEIEDKIIELLEVTAEELADTS